jgi:hypothetical protein
MIPRKTTFMLVASSSEVNVSTGIAYKNAGREVNEIKVNTCM